jgi:hypothetical protein
MYADSARMARSGYQRLKPLVAGISLLTLIALVYTLFHGGIAQFQMSSGGTNVLHGDNHDEGHLIQLTPSSKYSAGVVPSLETTKDVKVVSANLFDTMVGVARTHVRKRKMIDLTKKAENNSMQTLINTWTEGSYSPVHRHDDYSEVCAHLYTLLVGTASNRHYSEQAFVPLKGALAFFTFTDNGEATCNVLHDLSIDADRAIVVEKGSWHAMTAAPSSLGWPGYAVVFETSGHYYEPNKAVKVGIQNLQFQRHSF